MRYELITAGPSDNEWLEQLRRDVYADLFRATWGSWDDTRHARQFDECMRRGCIHIIVEHGERVGMLQVFERPDEVEVGEIQIKPSHQNRGLGACILRDLTSDAHENRKVVRLRVGLRNDGARKLYERLGFHLVSQSETHYELESRP